MTALRRRAVAVVTGVLVAGAVSLAGIYAWLPDPGALSVVNPVTTAFVELKCSSDCPLEWTPLPGISPFVKTAVVQAEDADFLEHGAVSWYFLRQAFLRNLREGRVAWGGSTLTMQLARNLYLSPERTLRRKLLEVLLAVKLERVLTKERILEVYLNVAEWAPDVFGVTAASRHYFDKAPADLGPLEASFLASILPSPGRAGEPDVRDRFSRKGAFIFERLLSAYLPAGQAVDREPEPCPEQLGEEEARMVDGVLAALFARHGLAVVSGDGALLGLDELLSPLEETQRFFVQDLVAGMAAGRPPIPCRRSRDGARAELTGWYQEEGSDRLRYWLPQAVFRCFQSLAAAAAAEGAPLLVRSAYRGPGYQTYLILRELRLRNYCLTPVRKLMEAPERSEHACLDSTAIDFGAPEGSGPAFSQTPAFRWLERNAADFGFSMSHASDDPDGIGFEPWHWRFGGEAAPGRGGNPCPETGSPGSREPRAVPHVGDSVP